MSKSLWKGLQFPSPMTDYSSKMPFEISIVQWDDDKDLYMVYYLGKDANSITLKGFIEVDTIKHIVLRQLFPDLFRLERSEFRGLDGKMILVNNIDRDIFVLSSCISSKDEVWDEVLQLVISHADRKEIRNTLEAQVLADELKGLHHPIR